MKNVRRVDLDSPTLDEQLQTVLQELKAEEVNDTVRYPVKKLYGFSSTITYYTSNLHVYSVKVFADSNESTCPPPPLSPERGWGYDVPDTYPMPNRSSPQERTIAKYRLLLNCSPTVKESLEQVSQCYEAVLGKALAKPVTVKPIVYESDSFGSTFRLRLKKDSVHSGAAEIHYEALSEKLLTKRFPFIDIRSRTNMQPWEIQMLLDNKDIVAQLGFTISAAYLMPDSSIGLVIRLALIRIADMRISPRSLSLASTYGIPLPSMENAPSFHDGLEEPEDIEEKEVEPAGVYV